MPLSEREPAAVPDVHRLPAAVRTRVVALAAEVLPEVSTLPAPLVSVARFPVARRARVGQRAILAALEDPDFRAVVGRLVAGHEPADAAAQDAAGKTSGETSEEASGGTPDQAGSERSAEGPAGDRAEVSPQRAAVAWLTGSEEAGPLVSALSEAEPAPDAQLERGLHRLRTRVTQLEEEARTERERHAEELAASRAENGKLRQRVGEARAETRSVREQTAELVAELDRLQAELEQARAQAGRSAQELQEARTELRSTRSDRRAGRDEHTLRTRLLLDALVDTASGLRRELALPATPGNPADRLEANLTAEEGTRTPSSAGALGTSSPALLDQLLALPRARLIVDGYNVTMAAWPDASLEQQRQRLLAGLSGIVARTGAETTVVFDAHTSPSRPVVTAPRGVRVVFSPSGVIADDVIRDLVAAEPAGRAVVVVTSDQAVVADIRRAGMRTASADALIALLRRSG